jgi:GDPmannose 4,6-dehydratase
MVNKRILVLGSNGQDGSYLVERELEKGQFVLGVGRQLSSRWVLSSSRFEYRSLDLSNAQGLAELLRNFNPDVVYHFAAIHGPAGFDYNVVSTQVFDVNVRAVQVILDHLREHLHCRLLYASSSKVFPSNVPLINNSTSRVSTCLYSLSKNMSEELIQFYRSRFGVLASVVWLFNHESVRRPVGYFIQKIAGLVADAVRGVPRRVELGNLNFWCDWGSAREYMEIVCDLSEMSDVFVTDLVVATGHTLNATDLVCEVFQAYHMDPAASIIDHCQPSHSVPPWKVDLACLHETIGRVPVVPAINVFKEVINQKLEI